MLSPAPPRSSPRVTVQSHRHSFPTPSKDAVIPVPAPTHYGPNCRRALHCPRPGAQARGGCARGRLIGPSP